MGIQTKFNNIKVRGICTVVGENKTSIDDLSIFTEVQKKKLKKNIGADKRYITNKYTTALDLVLQASLTLFKESGIDKSTVDGVIFITQAPDYLAPGNSHLLHKMLGLNTSCAVFDSNLGCSGYVYGLWLASMMLNGGCSRVLLCLADTPSKGVHHLDTVSIPIFGDAGSATIVDRDNNIDSETFFSLYSDGSGFEDMLTPASGSRMKDKDINKVLYKDGEGASRTLENFTMRGFNVFSFTQSTQHLLVDEILDYSGENRDSIDAFVFHQANGLILSEIIRKSHLPKDKVPVRTFSEYGNTAACSIPNTICNELRDHISNSKGRYILQGYGIGLSWGACCVELDRVCCPKIETFNLPYNGDLKMEKILDKINKNESH